MPGLNAPVIEVAHLSKSYGGRTVVDDVSFRVEEGEILGILGPNGAGKTTTVECLEGLRTPDGGTVRVCGRDPRAEREEVTRLLGAQLQESELQPKITVAEAMDLFASFYPQAGDWRALADRLGLSPHLGQRFGKLSGGQKQRLFIALALIGGPKVVVLDELTTGLDPAARRETWSLIEDVRDSGVTVLLVTHFMEEAERLCDRVVVIDNSDGGGGRVVASGTPADLAEEAHDDQVITFVPSGDLDLDQLRDLTGVRAVERRGPRVVVTGDEHALVSVTTALAAAGLVARQLRVQQATLDDAFLRITNHDKHDKAVR
jgi:ABC-2 type transport system ATP-binding protein